MLGLHCFFLILMSSSVSLFSFVFSWLPSSIYLFFNTAHVIYQLFKGKLQTKFSLCSFILDFLTWFCGVTSVFTLVFCSLEEFIQTSSIGEFRKRLQILFAFLGQNHISACLKINSRYNLFPLQLSFLENKREENSASF